MLAQARWLTLVQQFCTIMTNNCFWGMTPSRSYVYKKARRYLLHNMRFELLLAPSTSIVLSKYNTFMSMAAAVPTPGFEGFEKRLEIEFSYAAGSHVQVRRGLRNLYRKQLDELLSQAECSIVAELKNQSCDSYVLSESSLFVYPLKIVLKTCGTTQILKCIPTLLEFAAALDLEVRKCKYTRGTFMFPNVQPCPHGCFSDEVKYLENFFGYMGAEDYVFGDQDTLPKWHAYVAAMEQKGSAHHFPRKVKPHYTMEMCMVLLDKALAHQCYNEDGSLSGQHMTHAAGIDELLLEAEICAFAFYPCGYSMNALDRESHSTIHVTPEDDMSYASYEFMGCCREGLNLRDLVDGVLSVFRPAKFSISLLVDTSDGGESFAAAIASSGYTCSGSTRQDLLINQGSVVFHNFQRQTDESTQPFTNVSAPKGSNCGNVVEVVRSKLLVAGLSTHECREHEVLQYII